MQNSVNTQPFIKAFNKIGFGWLPAWVISKYLLAGAAFFVWVIFFAENDIPSSFKRVETLNKLQQTEQHLNKQIDDTRKDLDLLKTNPETIEKYARENYLMKKDNEDLFIIKALPESK
jgi:cell division protein FtsB